MARLAARERLPLRSVVLYLDAGAGANDIGSHAHHGPEGEPVLTWRYDVIHLWRWTADELVAVGRSGLMPLVGLTQIDEPSRSRPQVVAVIRTEPDRERQIALLRALIDLLPSEELIGMVQNVMTHEDVEELRRFPSLWRQYQEPPATGARTQRQIDILEAMVVRFDPPASEYRWAEQQLAAINDTARLDHIFQTALRADELSELMATISTQ